EMQTVTAGAAPVAMLARHDGSVLVSTGTAVVSYDRNRQGPFPIATTGTPASALRETSDGKLWGGSTDGAVWRLDQGVPQVVNHDLRERVVALLATRDGRDLWAASLGTGAVRLNRQHPEQRMVVTRANGLLGETLWTMLE